MAYDIIDRQTGRTVGTANTLKGAIRSVDRRDAHYGASRYTHRRVPGKRTASRKEQYACYIDCGPGAWDDRESESGDY